MNIKVLGGSSRELKKKNHFKIFLVSKIPKIFLIRSKLTDIVDLVSVPKCLKSKGTDERTYTHTRNK